MVRRVTCGPLCRKGYISSLPSIWLKTLFLECCFNISTIQLGVNFWCLGFHHSGLPAMSLQRPNPSKVHLYKRHSPYMWIKWTHRKHHRAHNTHNNSHCFYYLTPSHINNKMQSGLHLMCFFFFQWKWMRDIEITECSFNRVTFRNVKPLPGFRTTRAHM